MCMLEGPTQGHDVLGRTVRQIRAGPRFDLALFPGGTENNPMRSENPVYPGTPVRLTRPLWPEMAFLKHFQHQGRADLFGDSIFIIDVVSDEFAFGIQVGEAPQVRGSNTSSTVTKSIEGLKCVQYAWQGPMRDGVHFLQLDCIYGAVFPGLIR